MLPMFSPQCFLVAQRTNGPGDVRRGRRAEHPLVIPGELGLAVVSHGGGDGTCRTRLDQQQFARLLKAKPRAVLHGCHQRYRLEVTMERRDAHAGHVGQRIDGHRIRVMGLDPLHRAAYLRHMRPILGQLPQYATQRTTKHPVIDFLDDQGRYKRDIVRAIQQTQQAGERLQQIRRHPGGCYASR